MANFVGIVHHLSSIRGQNGKLVGIIHHLTLIRTQNSGDWSMSPSSGKTYSVGLN
jgi:hypothetical protein